jgi:hypothetical protein
MKPILDKKTNGTRYHGKSWKKKQIKWRLKNQAIFKKGLNLKIKMN